MELLGVNPHPSTGGVGGAVVDYVLFPDVKTKPIENHGSAVSLDTAAASNLVASRKGCASTKIDFTAHPDPASGATGDATRCVLRANGFSTEDAIGRVQRALNAAVAAKLDIDERFGANTTAAVKRYQSTRGLDTDGVVGTNTWKVLQSGRQFSPFRTLSGLRERSHSC